MIVHSEISCILVSAKEQLDGGQRQLNIKTYDKIRSNKTRKGYQLLHNWLSGQSMGSRDTHLLWERVESRSKSKKYCIHARSKRTHDGCIEYKIYNNQTSCG